VRIALTGVGHAFPGQPPLFRGVTETLVSGDVVALTGPSGSGKSTLLSIIAHWLTPTEGSVDVPENVVTVWVFQNPHGVAQRTALDHVVLPFLARGVRRSQAEREARQLLAAFDLEAVADRRFGALSGGEGQRLMLARAVARDAGLILVDEPTAQLDHTSAESVIGVLRAMAGRGAVVVVATHDPRVRDACTRGLDLAANSPAGAHASA
jgi:putative ABC transport system ATP-binding protein